MRETLHMPYGVLEKDIKHQQMIYLVDDLYVSDWNLAQFLQYIKNAYSSLLKHVSYQGAHNP